MMQSMKKTRDYIIRDIWIINNNSLDGRDKAQKRAYGSQKLRCNMYKRFCNVTSRTTYRSNFPEHDAVELVQELCEVPGQVMYKRITCMARMPAEKL